MWFPRFLLSIELVPLFYEEPSQRATKMATIIKTREITQLSYKNLL
ncbi:hypothetical protein D922_02927 [Enterococcus faecalis 06-MB-DW-09]|nr:hypothetical protein D931_01241 [Enterococcus faecium 13.SD.W.09]EPH90582.1 hypothetical protein D922_02927 [Enterococcus faecalis 06-MB-DW-09]